MKETVWSSEWIISGESIQVWLRWRLLTRNAHLPSLFFVFYRFRTSWTLPRGTIRFRLHCLHWGCVVYLHASPLRKPLPLFHSYRCVKLSERGILTARRKLLGFPCSRYTTVHQIRPDPCFQVGVRRSARALYQVWVKLLEHQTPWVSLLYLFKLKNALWSLHSSSGIPYQGDRMNLWDAQSWVVDALESVRYVCRRNFHKQAAECWHLLYMPFVTEKSDIIGSDVYIGQIIRLNFTVLFDLCVILQSTRYREMLKNNSFEFSCLLRHARERPGAKHKNDPTVLWNGSILYYETFDSVSRLTHTNLHSPFHRTQDV